MLNKTKLRNDIRGLLLEMMEESGTSEQAFDKFSDKLADCIDDYVKSGKIIITQVDLTSSSAIAGPYPVLISKPLSKSIT